MEADASSLLAYPQSAGHIAIDDKGRVTCLLAGRDTGLASFFTLHYSSPILSFIVLKTYTPR